MVKVKKDLTGMVFGKLTVLEQGEDYVSPNGKERKARWKCRCSCDGKEILVCGLELKRGHTTSCGCALKGRKNHKKYNRYEIKDNYVVMYTSKDEPFYVDLEDFEKVRNICWHKDANGYLIGLVNGKNTFLHRYITNCPKNMIPDHIHGVESIHDNRKSNLRIVTPSQNNMNQKMRLDNKSGVRGVYWDKVEQKWRAEISINGKKKHLGRFDDFEEAVRIRKEMEEKYFGEYSFDNSQKIAIENYGA